MHQSDAEQTWPLWTIPQLSVEEPDEPFHVTPGRMDLLLDFPLERPHALTLQHALRAFPTGRRVLAPRAQPPVAPAIARITGIRCNAILHQRDPVQPTPFPVILFERVREGTGTYCLENTPPEPADILGICLVIRTHYRPHGANLPADLPPIRSELHIPAPFALFSLANQRTPLPTFPPLVAPSADPSRHILPLANAIQIAYPAPEHPALQQAHRERLADMILTP